MEHARVAVTGVGVLAACGVGCDDFWAGLTKEPPQGRSLSVDGFDPSLYFKKSEARRVDRFAHFAVAAAEMALDDAGRPTVDPLRSGVIVGTGVGGLQTFEEQMRIYVEQGERFAVPYVVPMIMANAGAAHISMRLGWRGPCESITTACAAGTHSIGAAARLIQMGRCDAVLAGGAEAPLAEVGLASFGRLTALSLTGRSRPFDVARDGFVLAEGAAVVLVERLDSAVERGARIYAEIVGYASTADAHHLTAPRPDGAGAVQCMTLALEDAGVAAADVVQINAHGTSTEFNDAAEAAAIRTVFGSNRVPVTSAKGATGHSLGAAGAIEAAASVLSLHHRVIPPTVGHAELDPAMDIDVVTEATPFVPGPVVSNSFAFGGHNGTLVFVPPPAAGEVS